MHSEVGSSLFNHVQWEVTPVGHWFLIILIVPNRLVKQILKTFKRVIKFAIKKAIECWIDHRLR
jgi:hypothetical protein